MARRMKHRSVVMPFKSYAAYVKKLGANFKAAMHAGTVSAADALKVMLQNRTMQLKAVSSGDLRKSWQTAPFESRGKYGVIATNTQKYASVVEYGRRPGKLPPIGPLIRWAELKLHLSGKEAKSAAFAIAKTMTAKTYSGKWGRGLGKSKAGKRILTGAEKMLGKVFLAEVRRELMKAAQKP